MIASQPRVSVIIPCYNAARFVHRAIETALGQTYGNVEVVLVDDCSTDGLEVAADRYRDQIVFCRSSINSPLNSGPSRTRNTGVCCASGEVLAFLDADDWWPEDLLEKLVPQVSPGCAVCYDNHVIAEGEADQSISGRERETLLAEWLKRGPEDLCRENMEEIITIPSLFKIIVARRDYEEVGGFDERFFGIEDFHFFMKLLSQGTKIHIAPHPKGCYLVHPESLLRTTKHDRGRQVESYRNGGKCSVRCRKNWHSAKRRSKNAAAGALTTGRGTLTRGCGAAWRRGTIEV